MRNENTNDTYMKLVSTDESSTEETEEQPPEETEGQQLLLLLRVLLLLLRSSSSPSSPSSSAPSSPIEFFSEFFNLNTRHEYCAIEILPNLVILEYCSIGQSLLRNSACPGQAQVS